VKNRTQMTMNYYNPYYKHQLSWLKRDQIRFISPLMIRILCNDTRIFEGIKFFYNRYNFASYVNQKRNSFGIKLN
jgi:hypothetical protein